MNPFENIKDEKERYILYINKRLKELNKTILEYQNDIPLQIRLAYEFSKLN